MRWSYKTVHYELKKEGILGSAFLDESEVEISLNEYGKAGWELVSILETMDGVIAVFKQPLGIEHQSFLAENEPLEEKSQEADIFESATGSDPVESPDEAIEDLDGSEDFDVIEEYVEIEESEDEELSADVGSIRIE